MKKLFALLFSAASYIIACHAQPNQLNAQFYHNPYLLNPAMAAMDEGWSFYLGYAHQLTDISDANRGQALTASFRAGKTGVAIAGFQERQGLIAQTRIMGTYSYHILLDGDGRALHFGLSVGIRRQEIDESNIRGQVGDPVVAGFNEQRNYLNGAAGVAYTDANWCIQVAVPELAGKLSGTPVNIPGLASLLVGGGYRFYAERAASGITIEPKIYYRTFSRMPAVVDAGVSLGFKNRFTLDGLYHSSGYFTGGLSAAITSRLTGIILYSNGLNEMNFFSERLELGVKYNIDRP